MSLFEQIINHKVNTITGRELFQYGEQFQINITKAEADKIAAYVRGKKINLFQENERAQLLQQIASMTSPETAEKISILFQKFTK